MNKIKIYLQELRTPFLTVTIIPVIIGTIYGVKETKEFLFNNFLYVFFGFVFLHLGTNVFNDYFDYKNGTDNINNEYIYPFTGGSRLIQTGQIKPEEVLIEGILLFVVGTIFFIPLIMNYKILFLVLLFSLFAGIFYVAPPFKWAHRGLGEILIFLSFGPLMVLTSYYVQSGENFINALLISIPVGLFAASIVEINQFPDFNADKITGKKNLLVRFGQIKGIYLYFTGISIAYFFVFFAIYLKIISYLGIIILLTIPVAIKVIKILFENYKLPSKLTPACGMTIFLHLINGIIIILGIVTN
jgi:1,4-dihydroxy-2-naphthoate octaprenyltransferase